VAGSPTDGQPLDRHQRSATNKGTRVRAARTGVADADIQRAQETGAAAERGCTAIKSLRRRLAECRGSRTATQPDPVALALVAADDSSNGSRSLAADERLPVKMLNDRILVRHGGGCSLGQRTGQGGEALGWAEVGAAGPDVRSVETGDQVL